MKWEEKKERVLYKESHLTSFFPISPLDPEGASKSREFLKDRVFQRAKMADLLERYNRDIGNDQAALRQIEALGQESSVCVMTGQQLGLFGGPSYTILKAISCLILARKEHAVPIFWLATEDHDIAEIDHTHLLNSLGNLSKFSLPFARNGQFVEDLQLTSEHHKEIEKFFELVDQKQLTALIKDETSYSRAMVKILVSLFKETGLIFVEPFLLRSFAKDFFLKEITECESINETLNKTTASLIEAGGTPLLDVSEGTNLFFKADGNDRKKIRFENGSFVIGQTRYAKEALLQLVEAKPERFSTNAQARCVLQNSLFPVLAYVAGPSEIQYYQQLADYHRYHEITVPWIVPRMSVTMLTPQATQILQQCSLNPWEEIPEKWNMPDDNEALVQEWLQSAVKYYGKDLSKEFLARFVHLEGKKVQRKAFLSRLRKEGIALHSLHYLRNLIHPYHKPQERVINWFEFQAGIESSLIQELIKTFNDIPSGHLYIYL